jgi:hypothetical protein
MKAKKANILLVPQGERSLYPFKTVPILTLKWSARSLLNIFYSPNHRRELFPWEVTMHHIFQRKAIGPYKQLFHIAITLFHNP